MIIWAFLLFGSSHGAKPGEVDGGGYAFESGPRSKVAGSALPARGFADLDSGLASERGVVKTYSQGG